MIYFFSAPSLMALYGEFRVVAADTTKSPGEYNPKTDSVIEYRKSIFDDRENAAIDVMVSDSGNKVDSNTRYLPLFFGIAHDFKNNIEDFNNTHDTNIALVRYDSTFAKEYLPELKSRNIKLNSE